MPNVSVIVPAFNRARLLRQSIPSILEQTYKDFELIVVDDGSSDDTQEYLKSISDDRLNLLSIKRSGPAVARNEGAKVATGKYLAFCDSDDLWEKEKLEIQMPFFDKPSPPILVFSNAKIIENDQSVGKTIFDSQRPFKTDMVFRLLMDNFIPTSTVVLSKKAFFKTAGFENIFCPAEDYRLWLRMVALGSVDFVHRSLAFYRRHPSQVGSDLSTMFIACADVICHCLNNSEMTIKDFPGLDKRLWRLHFVAGRHFMKKGKDHMAREQYSRANRYFPFSKSRLFQGLSYLGI